MDDLATLGLVEPIDDPSDRRPKRIRFSHRGYDALMHGLGVLREIEAALRSAVGARRMLDLHDTLKLIIKVLQPPS